ncbi:MAG: choice-of-anchor tandem repeat GloVer-containing protein [Bryobacteraceae bacterium]|jgi:uncharacterized repeat protein (TIGR03803 family)
MLPLALSAQTFTTLYNFCTQPYEACAGFTNITLGPQGELYGIAGGGWWNLGTVYELLPPASPGGAWREVVLHSFRGGEVIPQGGLAMGPNGSLYGFAESTTPGVSMAFRLDPPTSASTDWAYAVISEFTGVADGGPNGAPVFGSPLGYGQSLYGVTSAVGENGAVYRLTPPPVAGGVWTQEILYAFPSGSSAGASLLGSLAVGAGGSLFGVTGFGGYVGGICSDGGGCGMVFSLTPPAVPGGPWTEQVLHAFDPGIGDGSQPRAGLVLGPGGVLYGTTSETAEGLSGTVFSLTPPTVAGAPMTETILHVFNESGRGDGWYPDTPLVLGPNGVLYGTTYYGGDFDCGTVFELVPPATPGGDWTETVLHSFNGASDGYGPNGIALAPDGTLYGTTYIGGSRNGGTLFALTP